MSEVNCKFKWDVLRCIIGHAVSHGRPGVNSVETVLLRLTRRSGTPAGLGAGMPGGWGEVETERWGWGGLSFSASAASHFSTNRKSFRKKLLWLRKPSAGGRGFLPVFRFTARSDPTFFLFCLNVTSCLESDSNSMPPLRRKCKLKISGWTASWTSVNLNVTTRGFYVDSYRKHKEMELVAFPPSAQMMSAVLPSFMSCQSSVLLTHEWWFQDNYWIN